PPKSVRLRRRTRSRLSRTRRSPARCTRPATSTKKFRMNISRRWPRSSATSCGSTKRNSGTRRPSMERQIERRRKNRKFFMGVDARQLAAAFFLVAVLIVISALLGRELSLINIIILSAMVVAAMGLGLWYLIFHGLRQAANGNLDMMVDLIASNPEGRMLTTKDG